MNHRIRRAILEGSSARQKRQLNRIYVRDKGICHLCQNFVPREKASRDHIIPVFKGTIEDARDDDNIKLAHEKCNRRRKDALLPAPISPLTYKIGDLYNLIL